MTPTTPSALLLAWTDALPAVLALLGEQERGLFRHELQRFCAQSRFQEDQALTAVPPLREMLLQSVRAAGVPAAIQSTRDLPDQVSAMTELCEHLLAQWRDAEAVAPTEPCARPGAEGGVVFGPRLGGPGRPGAMQRSAAEED